MHESGLPLLSSLLILIVFSRLMGRLMSFFGQPELLGAMIAGVLLGPAVFHIVEQSQALNGIVELAVFFIIFSAGLEIEFDDVIEAFKGKGFLASMMGFLLPMGASVGLARLFQMDWLPALSFSLALSITALPVSMAVLNKFSMTQTKLGGLTIATAVFCDVAALLGLGILLNLTDSSGELDVNRVLPVLGEIGTKLLVFALFVFFLDWISRRHQTEGPALTKVPEAIVRKFGHETLFALCVIFVMLFSFMSESLGLHFVIGAFFGATLLKREFFLKARFKEIEKTLESFSSGLLSPVFFAYLGLSFGTEAFLNIGFLLSFLGLLLVSKIVSGLVAGKLIALGTKESLGVGMLLCSRGAMDLVVANIAYNEGLLDSRLFSALVVFAIVSTAIGPILFKVLMNSPVPKESSAD